MKQLTNTELEISENYQKKMQIEAAFAALNGEDPEFPECPIYMEAFSQTKHT